MTGIKPREFAARALLTSEQPGDFIEHRLEHQPGWNTLSDPDRRLAQEIVFGVTRWRAAIDWIIGQCTDGRPIRAEILTLLRIGLYQIFWLDRIPPHAAVDCSVELAHPLGVTAQRGFINAVLRSCLRSTDLIRKDLADLRARNPAIGWSHPEWLVDRWLARHGKSVTALLEWDNSPPPTYARANALRMDPGRLLELWREEGVEYEFFHRDWLPENLIFKLRSHPPLARLPSFIKGGFYIQDPSTLLAVRELSPQSGETILDLCAAPGGKTTLIAQRMANRGRIVAFDQNPDRLRLVRENCERLGVTCVETGPYDPVGIAFDRILVDAPCSNTGVLRRRIELRWRITPAEITRLAESQSRLLDRAAAQLRPGGVLVYSTCSLEEVENQAVVKAFLARHPNFQLERERELIPYKDGVDGAYVARLVSA